MLVRRIATVTISAPLASTARRVSSKSLYFPVPISRRERYARPAMRSGSAICSARRVGAFILAPTDGHDDLERVAFGEPGARVAAARHDFAVHFDGNALPRKFQFFEKPRKIDTGLHTLDLAVDGKLDHFENTNDARVNHLTMSEIAQELGEGSTAGSVVPPGREKTEISERGCL